MSYFINESKLKLNITKQKIISSLLINNYELVSICFARVFTNCHTIKSWLYSGLEGGLTLVVDYRTKCGRLILFDLTTFEMTFEAEMYKKFDTFYTKLSQNIHCFEVQKGFIGFEIPDVTEAEEFFTAMKGLTESIIYKKVKEFKPIAANDLKNNAKKMLALLKARLNDEYYFKDTINPEASIEFNAGELENILELIEFDESENTFIVHGRSSDVEDLLKKVSDIKCTEKGGLKIADKRAYALQMANNLINTQIAEKNQIEFFRRLEIRKAEEKKAREAQKMNATKAPAVPGVPKVPGVPPVPSAPKKGVPPIPAGKGGVPPIPKIPGLPPKIPPVPTAPQVKPPPPQKVTAPTIISSSNTSENAMYDELQAKKNKLKHVEIPEPQTIGSGKIVGATDNVVPTTQINQENQPGQQNNTESDNNENSEMSDKKARPPPKLDMIGELKMKLANREKASNFNFENIGQKSKTEQKQIDFRANLKSIKSAINVSHIKKEEPKVIGREVVPQQKEIAPKLIGKEVVPQQKELAPKIEEVIVPEKKEPEKELVTEKREPEKDSIPEKKEPENEGVAEKKEEGKEAITETKELGNEVIQEKEVASDTKDAGNVDVPETKEPEKVATVLLEKRESVPVVRPEIKIPQKDIPIIHKKKPQNAKMSKMIESLGQKMVGKSVVASSINHETTNDNTIVTISSSNQNQTPSLNSTTKLEANVGDTSTTPGNSKPIVAIAASSNTPKMDISKLIAGMEKSMTEGPKTEKPAATTSSIAPTKTNAKPSAIPKPLKGIPPIPTLPPSIPKLPPPIPTKSNVNATIKPTVTATPVTITTNTVKSTVNDTSIQEEITKGVKLKKTVTQEKFGLNYKKETESEAGKNISPQGTEAKSSDNEMVKGNLFSELKKVQLKKINK